MRRLVALLVVSLTVFLADPAMAHHQNGKPHKAPDNSLVNRLQAGGTVQMWAPYYLPSWDGRYYWEELSGWNSFSTSVNEPARPYIKFAKDCGPMPCPPGKVGVAYTWDLYPGVYFIWLDPDHRNNTGLIAHEIGHFVIPTDCGADPLGCHGEYPYKGAMRDPTIGSNSTGRGDDHWICESLSRWCL